MEDSAELWPPAGSLMSPPPFHHCCRHLCTEPASHGAGQEPRWGAQVPANQRAPKRQWLVWAPHLSVHPGEKFPWSRVLQRWETPPITRKRMEAPFLGSDLFLSSSFFFNQSLTMEPRLASNSQPSCDIPWMLGFQACNTKLASESNFEHWQPESPTSEKQYFSLLLTHLSHFLMAAHLIIFCLNSGSWQESIEGSPIGITLGRCSQQSVRMTHYFSIRKLRVGFCAAPR